MKIDRSGYLFLIAFLFFIGVASDFPEKRDVVLSLKLTARGERFLDSGKLNKAEDEFKKAIGHYGNNYKAHALMGVIFSRKGDFNKSCAFFEKSIKVFPEYKKEMTFFLKREIARLTNKGHILEKTIDLNSNGDMQIRDFMCGSQGEVFKRKEERNRVLNARARLEKLNKRIEVLKKRLNYIESMDYEIRYLLHYAYCLIEVRKYNAAKGICNQVIGKGVFLKRAYLLLIKAFILEGDCVDAKKKFLEAKGRGIDIDKGVEDLFAKFCR